MNILRSPSAQKGSDSVSGFTDSDSDEEVTLENEIEELKERLKLYKARGRQCKEDPLPPLEPSALPAYEDFSVNGDRVVIESDSLPEGAIFRPVKNKSLYSVMEVPNLNNTKQMARQHIAVSFKELKALKEALSSYGALAPFMVHV